MAAADALARLDAVIGGDPRAALWSFNDHARGSLHEAERLMTLRGAEAATVDLPAARGPRSITAVRIKRRGGPPPGAAGSESPAPDARGIADAPGTGELCRFLSLLDAINRNTPWAPHPFSANDSILRELVSNHLNLIVGEERATRHGGRLRALIGSGLTPSNLCWISASRPGSRGPGPDPDTHPGTPANRQQGKTTTLSKFIAALAIGSIAGGNMLFVYSTGLDRAQEVVSASPDPGFAQVDPRRLTPPPVRPRSAEASRAVIDWLRRTRHVENAGFDKIRVEVDNARSFGIRNPAGTINEIAARPRTVESCRGDNPAAVVVDESGSRSRPRPRHFPARAAF